MKKLTKVEWIIIITIIVVLLYYGVLPMVLLKIYGSRPYYEVPTWVIYFLRMRGL